MRIAWISHSAGLNGAERCLVESVAAVRSPDNVSIVVLPSVGPLRSILNDEGAETEIIAHPWWIKGVDRGQDVASVIRSLRRPVKDVLRYLRKTQPDVVVTNTIVCPVGAIVAKLLRIPHVWYIHEFLEE